MQRSQWQSMAIVAALATVLIAVASGRLPRWLRVTLVLGLLFLAGGGGLFAYRYFTHPTTLTVAAGSFDGDAVKLMSTIATRLASNGSPVRLNIVDKGNVLEAAKAFSSGQADLAVVRADIEDLSAAETVVVVTRAAVLIVAPPGSSITEMDDLKRKTVGVVGGEMNHKVTEALTNEYSLDGAKTQFKDLSLPDIPQALKTKQVDALLVVMPVTDKYLKILRNLFPTSVKQKTTPSLVPIESAEAIASVTKYYQTYDLPKGTVQGSPPVPDEDMKTLRVPFYLVANKKLSDDVVSALAQSIMDARRDLLGAYPIVAEISEPNTDRTDSDSDTYFPVHPGAAAYFGGNVQSFFDKYSNQIFYGSMLLGMLTSVFAGAWKFIVKDEDKPENQPLMRLYALTDQVTKATTQAELTETEQRIDSILKDELRKYAIGDADAAETGAMGLATHRLEHLIAQRRAQLAGAG